MQALQADLRALAPMIEAAAREAGALALEYFRPGERTSAGVWNKEGGSPVTAADLAVDRLLRQRLSDVIPDIGWLSEEAEIHPHEGSAEPAWIVDPIDGTRAFMAGEATWAVSIGLVEQGRPALACLYLPALHRMYVAVSGAGATCDGVRLPADSRLPPLAAGPKPALDRFLQASPRFEAHPKIPSLASRIAMAADGQIAVAIASGGAREWDVAAADLIIREAGGRLTDLASLPVRYEASPRRLGVLIASREPDHEALARTLGAALAKSHQP
ncbi:MAG: 3'(2'),5'-bisphosphate nucleotidase CysQ [Beijerinckiaceae bacterium]